MQKFLKEEAISKYLFIFIYLFGCAGSQLWHAGSLVVAMWGSLVAVCGD